MLNVSELINDPDFCQTFTVTRNTGDFTDGYFVTTPSAITMTGVIQPLNTEETNQLPEGDRLSGAIKVYTLERVYLTHITQPADNTGYIADEITWKGEKYKVIQSQNYLDYGYHRTIAIRKLGA